MAFMALTEFTECAEGTSEPSECSWARRPSAAEEWVVHPRLLGRHDYVIVEPKPTRAALILCTAVERSQESILPPDLEHIEEAIRRSRLILEIEPDEDAGVPGPYGEAVLDRAAEFLRKHALWLWTSHGVVIDAPRLEPGPNGSIDIHWKTPCYELLVNIPREPSALAGFYGDDYGSISIEGTLDPSASNRGLLMWLMDNA